MGMPKVSLAQADDASQRLYERIPGGNTQVTLQISERPQGRSRSATYRAAAWPEKAGTAVKVKLPSGDLIQSRVMRNVNDALGLAFRQDEASLVQIDCKLVFIRESNGRQAA
jgi:hypothetical protein